MKCPYCDYSDGYDFEIDEVITGNQGGFYKLTNNIQASRSNSYWENEYVDVCACPSCHKVFIDD